MRDGPPLLLDWHYFWGPLIIIGTIVYLCVILIRFWRDAFRKRSDIYAGDPVAREEQLRTVIPIPHAADKADPRYMAYRDWFYPRFRDVMVRSAVGWLLIVLIGIE